MTPQFGSGGCTPEAEEGDSGQVDHGVAEQDGGLGYDERHHVGAWTQAYRAVGQEEYPHIWRVRDELPLVTDDAIFEAVLAIMITGLCERAPRPCTCGAHPGGAAPD